MRIKPLSEFFNSEEDEDKRTEKPTKKARVKGLWELPEGWRWVRLREVAEIVMGQSPPSDTYNTNGIGLPFFQGSKDFGTIYPTPRVWCSNPQRIAKKGDILISVRAPVGSVNIAAEDCVIGRGLAAIRPLKVERMFLFYFLKSYEDKWTGFGSTFDAIRKKELQNFLIPFPPIEEQKRIVAKLDEIHKRLEEAMRLAKEAKEEAQRLMVSALHEVFSKAQERGWKWVKFEKLFTKKPQYGLTAKSHEKPRGVIYLRISDIDELGNLKTEGFRYVEVDSNTFKKYCLNTGDILIARSGSVGRMYLHRDMGEPMVFASYLIRISLNPSKILPKYMFYFGLSPEYWAQVTEVYRKVAQPNLNAKEISRFQIPLPPIEEQKRIVTYLDLIHERAQKLVKLYEEQEKELEKLFPSILDRAFRGKL